MDKLKVILKKLKKHHFWIVCSLVTLVAMVMVMMAIGTLNDETEGQKSKISSTFSSVETLQREQLHPNPEYHVEQAALNKKASDAIDQAWASRYQRQADLLVWPEDLESRLVRKVEVLRPIESSDVDDSSFNMPTRQERGYYSDFIENELPKLAELIGARWSTQTSGGMGDAEVDEGPAPLVNWDASNQRDLKQRHFDWNQSDPEGIPTTLQVLYAQEDLWVLEALMEIIKDTNGDEIAAHKMNISQIHEISIGRAAGEPSGNIYEPSGGAVASGPPTGDDGGVPTGAPNPFGGAPGVPGAGGGVGGAAAGGAGGADPADGRYVDRDYRPLSGADLRMNVDKEDPEVAYLAVAKRMPVRMRFTMDQRRIPRLLLACANSDLTVEVRQVHVSMQTYEGDPGSGSGAGGGGMSGGMGGIPGMGGGVPGVPGIPGVPRAGGGGGPAPRPSGGSGGSQRVYDADVEIYGIIYIYNPVNREKLDIEADKLDGLGAEGGAGDAAP